MYTTDRPISARRDRRAHEAHYGNLSQYERDDVEDNKRCNRGTQPGICR